jgi:thymidylate synthase
MSYVDDIFISDLKEILEETWEVDNRSTWKSGEQPKTKRILQVSHKYDLSKGFPILALREQNFKAAIDEMLWIYVRLSNNVKDLNSKIWNAWKNENGEIEKAYGYQIAKPTMGFPSQSHYVINEIKTNPTSRRIQTNMFNAKEQLIKSRKSLIECAFGTMISVKDGKLHMTLTQRSGDKLTASGAGGWNVIQYASLMHAIAMECDLEVGVLKHDIQDLHLYDKHIDQTEEMLRRYELAQIDTLPTLKVKKKPFFDLTVDDFELDGYKHLGSIGKVDVTV